MMVPVPGRSCQIGADLRREPEEDARLCRPVGALSVQSAGDDPDRDRELRGHDTVRAASLVASPRLA
jgi:hypothetical protein